jgi:hypothetical protein
MEDRKPHFRAVRVFLPSGLTDGALCGIGSLLRHLTPTGHGFGFGTFLSPDRNLSQFKRRCAPLRDFADSFP